LGAVAAGADTTLEDKLGEFAWNLGMAFQLIDDMLDFVSSEATLGKPVGGDLKEGKVTLPLVYALETATAVERRAVEAVLRDRNYEETPFAGVLEMVERRGGVQRTRERAAQFTERARQIVAQFPGNPYQRALFTLTELITERDR
jgi:octaprenyl-diphosphate synthase